MLSIKVSTRGLAIAKERVVANANRRYRAIIYKMFEDMLDVSAQYSGDFTMNWVIMAGEGHGDPGYRQSPEKAAYRKSQIFKRTDGSVGFTGPEPHAAGDLPAIDYARQNAVRVPFNYKDKVYFVNPTPLHFTETTVTGPDGKTQNLRPENIIPGGVLIKSYLLAKYGGRA